MRNVIKNVLIVLFLMLGITAMAQQKIQLHPTGNSKFVKSDMSSLKATFSFSVLEAQDYKCKEGDFSAITLPNTVIGGNVGDPEIPVVNKLIAVPVGATPRIEVKSYNVEEYNLDDYGIKTLVPRQPSLRKDKKPEDVPFVYNKANYQKKVLNSAPTAVVEVVGTMRGVRLGRLTIEPVSYDPTNNKLRVFNDIDVEVSFEGADTRGTEDLLAETYSPYFDVVYNQLFNSNVIKSVYEDHPDLYTTPVKMLVVTTATYANSTPFQEWLTWKKQKGFDVDVQTVANNATAATIKNTIYSRYNANHPTFLVLVGDETVVTCYQLWNYGSSAGNSATDLEYASVDGDIYHDMFLSRMPVSSVTELGYLVHKTLTYEKYTMSDPSYLSNVLLIAGEDATWAPRVGRPTINYAADNYFNAAHGFANVHKYVTSNYNGCYNYLSSGVGFANYTAHGDIQMWYSPQFTNDNVNALTNNDKYFWAMGNCCLTANFKNATSNKLSFGEAMVRAANKGAFGYIGSVPESYWYEDYYFGVGATSIMNQTPTQAQTKTGVYDAMFNDTGFNTLNAVPFVGNLAVSYAYSGSYSNSSTSGCSEEYYWRAYQCFGDGSVMPYLTQPAANTVNHANTIIIGAPTFTVSADPSSYVSITKNNEILGVAQVPEAGTVEVPINGLVAPGEVMVVITRQQRQPYITTIQAIAPDGPYLTLDSFEPNTAHVGDATDLSLTFKNVGIDATSGITTITLTPNDDNVTVESGQGTLNVMAAETTATVTGLQISIAEGVADGTVVSLHYAAVCGEETWEGDFNVTATDAVLEYKGMTWDASFEPGETLTVTAKFKNVGHFQATNAKVTASSTSGYVSIAEPTVNIGTVEVDGEVTAQFAITIDANCPETAQLPLTFEMTADGGLTAQGEEALKNTCIVYFDLADSYSGNDGWNGATLVVSFDDGTPTQNLTIPNGASSAQHALEIGNGVHVTLTWTKGSYDNECSFTVSYGEGMVIYQMPANSNPTSGLLYQFDCNCAAATQAFTVTVASENTNHGTVSGGGEFTFGQTCTVTATPASGYMFTGWTWKGNLVSNSAQYTFNVTSDMNLVAHFAEGLMIGDGGTATNDYLPTYNYYKYSLTEQIYTATELGEAGTITGIAFYNAGAEKTRTLDLYLKNTTKAKFSSKTDWVKVNASDKVFSGSVTMTSDGWTMITFTTPFEYDGTSNVVLVTDDNTGNYTNSPHMSCRVFSAASQAIYIYDDNTNFNPSSPPTSGSNYALLSQKNQLVVTKQTSSSEPVTITVSANPEEGGTVTGGGEYQSGETCTVTATPNGEYVFAGWTEDGTLVSSDMSYSFTATADRNLVANFIIAIEIGTDVASHTYLPSYCSYKYSMTEQIYTAEELGTAGKITSIAFYNKGPEKTRSYDFYMKATTKSEFADKTDWIAVAESDKVFSGSVTMTSGGWTYITFTTPFVYNGSSNVVFVAVDNSGEGSDSPYMSCSTFSTTTKQAHYMFRDVNGAYDPTAPATQTSSNGLLSSKNHILISKEPTDVPPCAVPTDLSVSDITDNSAVVSWQGEAAGYTLQFMRYVDDATMQNETAWTTVSDVTSPYTLNELESGAPYVTRVKAVCGANSESDWTEAVQFTTILMGDANGNGGIDIGDAVCIVNYVVGQPNTTFNAIAADLNHNGQIDVGDAVMVVNIVVGVNKDTPYAPAMIRKEDRNKRDPQ